MIRTARPGPGRVIIVAALAAVVAALAVIGVRAVAPRQAGDGGAGVDPQAAAAVDAVVPELEAFVESARGLKFLRPVKVAVLGDAAFRRKLSGGNTTDEASPDVAAGVLRALGLVASGEDLSSARALDAHSVAGFYDTGTKELVVRGTRPTPFVRQVLVHELTHALDDQHFDIDPDLADDEAVLAFDALVEGDATAMEYRYVDAMSPEDRRAAADEEDATFGPPGPDSGHPKDLLGELEDFPYAHGPGMVDALLAAGGPARLDAAFASPPGTSADVLHPDRYLAGRGRAPVPHVAADGRVVDDGVVGEFLLSLVMSETLPEGQAEQAAAGWAGDRYVAWRAGRRTCVRATVVLDAPAETAELAVALRRWAEDHRGATVDVSTSVTFTRCG